MASLESFTATTADSVPLHSKSRRGMTDSPLGQRPLSQQLAQAPPFPLCRLWARNSFNAKDSCFGIFLSLILSNQSLLQMPAVSQNTVSKNPLRCLVNPDAVIFPSRDSSSLPHKTILLSSKPFSSQRSRESRLEGLCCCSSEGEGKEGRCADEREWT